MRSKVALGAAAALGLALLTPGAAVADPGFLELNPGGLPSLEERIDVNVVLVGFGETDLGGVPDAEALDLPATYEPVIRYRLFYPPADGQSEQAWRDQADLGLRYSFDYNIVTAGATFEQALAQQLTASAETMPVTLFQGPDYYGSQTADGVVAITRNSWIDGPETEEWLAVNAGLLGSDIDPRDPTVFLLDASAIAPDLGPHVYVKTDTEDPDTGYNFGEVRASRKMTAWGGTPGSGNRVWFYDMSAGPEGWSDNWNVDDEDLDGDGEPDYRIPPIWHYTGSPRSYDHPGFGPATLTEDLGKVVRYVAVNLLFASSPLYPPFFTPDRIPDTVELDLNVVEWWKNVDVSKAFVKADLIASSVTDLPAGPEITVSPTQDLPFSGDWARCFQGFAQYNKLCYNDLDVARGRYDPFANLFLASARNQGALLDGSADYEAALVGYGIGSKAKDPQGLLGYADDNWLNGTQSGVFNFVDPVAVSLGYGMTTTMIHEYGHHSSMSHPHDGYDSATRVDYGPGGKTQYAWLGDMSHTIMSYMDLAIDFGQFDLDNSARHHAAGYAKIANAIAADVLDEDPSADLTTADNRLVAAQAALEAHDYAAMLGQAKAAYESVVAVATAHGVPVTVQKPSTWTLAGPVKPGNGNRADRVRYAIDLDQAHNVKRMYSK